MKNVLEASGSSMSQVIKCTVFLKDVPISHPSPSLKSQLTGVQMNDFSKINTVYEKAVRPLFPSCLLNLIRATPYHQFAGHKPARSCVEVRLLSWTGATLFWD